MVVKVVHLHWFQKGGGSGLIGGKWPFVQGGCVQVCLKFDVWERRSAPTRISKVKGKKNSHLQMMALPASDASAAQVAQNTLALEGLRINAASWREMSCREALNFYRSK